MPVVEVVLAAETATDRNARALGPGAQAIRRLPGPAAAAHQHERPLRAREQALQFLQVRGRRRGARRAKVRHIGDGRFREQHVLRQREQDGTRPAGGRDVERVADIFGNAFRAIDLRDPFGERAVHAPVIHFLEGLALDEVVADLADEDDHRRRILVRGVHADRSIGGARTARHEQHARLAGELGPGIRHVGRAAFLAADGELELVLQVMQSIQHRQETLAGHAERHAHPVTRERVGEDTAAVSRLEIRLHAPQALRSACAQSASAAFVVSSTRPMVMKPCTMSA